MSLPDWHEEPISRKRTQHRPAPVAQPKSESKSLCEPIHTQTIVSPSRSPTALYCSLILTDQTWS